VGGRDVKEEVGGGGGGGRGCMRSTQCYVDFVYQLSILSRTEKNHGIHRSIWPFSGPSGCILTSKKVFHREKKKNLSTFLSNAPRLPKENCFWKVPRLRPFVLVKATCGWSWWNDTDRGRPITNTRRKTCPSTNLANTNLTYTGLGWNPGLRGVKEVTIYKKLLRTSQRTQYASIRKINRLKRDGGKKWLFIVGVKRNMQVHCVVTIQNFQR